MVFAFLCRKDAETEKRLIDVIHTFASSWLSQSIMRDLGQTSIKTYETSFPNVKLSGCYFHLRQNVYPKMQVRNLIIIN